LKAVVLKIEIQTTRQQLTFFSVACHLPSFGPFHLSTHAQIRLQIRNQQKQFLRDGGKRDGVQLLKEMWLSNKKVIKPVSFKKKHLSKFLYTPVAPTNDDAQELLSFC
jgi:hypothetical protein